MSRQNRNWFRRINRTAAPGGHDRQSHSVGRWVSCSTRRTPPDSVALALLFGSFSQVRRGASSKARSAERERRPDSHPGIVAIVGTSRWCGHRPRRGWPRHADHRHRQEEDTSVALFMNRLDDLRKNAAAWRAQRPQVRRLGAAGAAEESAPALIVDVGAPVIAGVLAFIIVTLFCSPAALP